MTRHLARRERRAAERKAKKAEEKRLRVSAHVVLPSGPALEHEFSTELIAEANATPESVPGKAGLKPPDGFVSQTVANPLKRAEINRANAQHSTGPQSAEGKVASSRNSLKHGLASGEIIIVGEDRAAFEALLHNLLEEHQPANVTEELLVNEMAQSYWLTQRALRLQNECFAENAIDEKHLALFMRYQTTHDRAFHKALTTLINLKRAHGFVSRDSLHRAAHEVSGLAKPGFVSQNHADRLSSEQFVRQNASIEPHQTAKSLVEAA